MRGSDNQVIPGIIGVLITDILNPFFPELVRGVIDEARTDGYGLMLYDTAEDAQSEEQIFHALASSPIDGVIVCASRISETELVSFYERQRKPMVVINRVINHPHIPCILVDYISAMSKATQHLLDLDHSRIAYLAGPIQSEASKERRRGIELTLLKAGYYLKPEWTPSSYPNEVGGFQAMSSILSQPRSTWPSAVIAYNDVMALGALQAIRTKGLRIPEDISVIGVDDILMAAHTIPPLTTVQQPKAYMGKLAMQTLRRILREEVVSSNGYILVESPLVVRNSTAPYRTTS